MTAAMVHPFERDGLGVAPFRCVRVERRVGPLRQIVDFGNGPVECEVGSPGQPMGCCAYCSQGIAECCVIRDAKGKEFIVGNVCVYKAATEVQDRTLAVTMKREMRQAKADRERTASAELAWRIENDADLRAMLSSRPHPMPFRAEKGDTLLDWSVWMMANAGASGRKRVSSVIAEASK